MTLRFDAAAHTYTDPAGRRVPSVTTILGAVPPWLGRFGQVPAEVLEHKREVGEDVHRATALEDQGLGLDPATITEDVGGYLEAWHRYKAETRFVPVHVETLVHHPTRRYAGTLDRLGTIGRAWWLPDIKTGAEQDAELAGPQTAAYLDAALAMGLVPASTPVQRCTVHLRENGTYRIVPHTDYLRDREVFRAALTLYHFNHRR